MGFIIGLIIILFILSLIKQIISNHKAEILAFIGVIGAIVAIVICINKFGAGKVIKGILIIIVAFIAYVFLESIVLKIVKSYYDHKAVKTEKKIRDYVFRQPKCIRYSELQRNTVNCFGRIKLGKKYNVTDYIDEAIKDFTTRNANEIYQLIRSDVKERIYVEYDEYYNELNHRFGAYCLGTCPFQSWVDYCLNEFAIKNDEGGVVKYLEKHVGNDHDKPFQGGKFKRTVIEDDEDDYDFDDYNETEHEIEQIICEKISAEDVPPELFIKII